MLGVARGVELSVRRDSRQGVYRSLEWWWCSRVVQGVTGDVGWGEGWRREVGRGEGWRREVGRSEG